MLGREFVCSPYIRDLPEGLKLLALMNQRESGNKPNENLKLIEFDSAGNFIWVSSREGFSFWADIDSTYGLKVE